MDDSQYVADHGHSKWNEVDSRLREMLSLVDDWSDGRSLTARYENLKKFLKNLKDCLKCFQTVKQYGTFFVLRKKF